jgi:hypothetical protein
MDAPGPKQTTKKADPDGKVVKPNEGSKTPTKRTTVVVKKILKQKKTAAGAPKTAAGAVTTAAPETIVTTNKDGTKTKKIVRWVIKKVVKKAAAPKSTTTKTAPKTTTTTATTTTNSMKTVPKTTAKAATKTVTKTASKKATPTKTTTPKKTTIAKIALEEDEVDLNDITLDDESVYDELTYYDEETLNASTQSFDEITLPDNDRDVWIEDTDFVAKRSTNATFHAGNSRSTTPQRRAPVVSPLPKGSSPRNTRSPAPQEPIVPKRSPVVVEKPFDKAAEIIDPFYDPVVGEMNPMVPWDTPKSLKEYENKHGRKLHTIKVFKDTQYSRVGMTVAAIGGYLFVLKINRNGLLTDTSLQVGDIIVSINEFSFRKFPNAKHAYGKHSTPWNSRLLVQKLISFDSLLETQQRRFETQLVMFISLLGSRSLVVRMDFSASNV